MLNSTVHEISAAPKIFNDESNDFVAFKLSDVYLSCLLTLKCQIVGILTFMGRINFMLNCVEHETGAVLWSELFYLDPGLQTRVRN